MVIIPFFWNKIALIAEVDLSEGSKWEIYREKITKLSTSSNGYYKKQLLQVQMQFQSLFTVIRIKKHHEVHHRLICILRCCSRGMFYSFCNVFFICSSLRFFKYKNTPLSWIRISLRDSWAESKKLGVNANSPQQLLMVSAFSLQKSKFWLSVYKNQSTDFQYIKIQSVFLFSLNIQRTSKIY